MSNVTVDNPFISAETKLIFDSCMEDSSGVNEIVFSPSPGFKAESYNLRDAYNSNKEGAAIRSDEPS